MPLVVISAVTLGGVAVINLRGAFGANEIFSWTGNGSEVIESINVKKVTYEIFGPRQTTGGVSYLNEDTKPVATNFGGLPWTYTMATTNPAVVANLVAQGDSNSIGCRITINGDVKDEQFATGHHAQVFCLVKAA